MRVVLNGKEIKNVDVTETGNKNVRFALKSNKGSWSLVMNRQNNSLFGVVNHGSIRNHTFRGFDWFKLEGETLIGV
tara:strand:- start:15 stop:242 length:228 start_codon:yes stop_codon:yes gene_type:complete